MERQFHRALLTWKRKYNNYKDLKVYDIFYHLNNQSEQTFQTFQKNVIGIAKLCGNTQTKHPKIIKLR